MKQNTIKRTVSPRTRPQTLIIVRSIQVVALLAAALTGISHTAQAINTQGSSSAYGASSDLSIVDLNTLVGIGVTAPLAPTPTASGTAPPAYNVTNSLAGISINSSSSVLGGGSISLSSGALQATASSTVDGGSGIRNAQASSSADNFNASLSLIGRTSLLNSASLFNFSTLTISSSASVTGDYGAFTTAGSTSIIDANGAADGFATFSVFGINYDVAVNPLGQVAPNTSLTINSSSNPSFSDSFGTDFTGSINIIFNEQVITGDGITSQGIQVNGLRVSVINAGSTFFNGLNLKIDDSNLANGELTVAHSEASLTALTPIPEPSTFCLIAAGAGLFFVRLRASSKIKAV